MNQRLAMPVGLAIGLLLDRQASRESGKAALRIYVNNRLERSSICWFRGIAVWRIDSDNDKREICDGRNIRSYAHGRLVQTIEADAGIPYDLQTFFPLRASIWGRMADDYYIEDASAGDDGILVRLRRVGSEASGEARIDRDTGVMRELILGKVRLVVESYELLPLPDDVFDVTYSAEAEARTLD